MTDALENALLAWKETPDDTKLRTIWRKGARAELKFLKSLRVPIPEGRSVTEGRSQVTKLESES